MKRNARSFSVDRRRLLKMVPALSFFSCARGGDNLPMLSHVLEMTRGQRLGILIARDKVVGPDGTRVGRMNLWQDIDSIELPLAISPDGRNAAWLPLDLYPALPSKDVHPGVVLFDGVVRRTISNSAKGAGRLAITDGVQRLFVTQFAPQTEDGTLVVLNAGGTLERDLTEFTRSNGAPDIEDIERLSTSADGSVLAFGTRDAFAVIAINQNVVKLMEKSGRFPSISPNGASVAFVQDRLLNMVDLRDQKTKSLMKGWAILGVGSWAPDNVHLLIGAQRHGTTSRKLVIADTNADRFVVVADLGDLSGDNCKWVSLGLVEERDR